MKVALHCSSLWSTLTPGGQLRTGCVDITSNFLRRNRKILRRVCTHLENPLHEYVLTNMEQVWTVITYNEVTLVGSNRFWKFIEGKKCKCQLKYTILRLWYYDTQNTKELCFCFSGVGNNISSLTSITPEMFLHATKKNQLGNKKKLHKIRKRTERLIRQWRCITCHQLKNIPTQQCLQMLNRNDLKDQTVSKQGKVR